jgi:hypothetical protein
MLDKINAATKNLRAKAIAADSRNGFEAALATIATMKKVRAILSPEQIIDADNPTLKDKERADLFFDAFADQTAKCIAEGTSLLANLWLTAWTEGKGETKMKAANLESPQFRHAGDDVPRFVELEVAQPQRNGQRGIASAIRTVANRA